MSGLNDGWDDESDLNDISQDNDLDFDGDGWGNDDDLDFGDEVGGPSDPVEKMPPKSGQSAIKQFQLGAPPQVPSSQSLRKPGDAALVASDDDGWGDDDLNFDDDTTPNDPVISKSKSVEQVIVTEDGWGDDDFGFDEENLVDDSVAENHTQPIETSANPLETQYEEDGWGDDLDFDGDDEEAIENEKSESVPTHLQQGSIPQPFKQTIPIPPPPKERPTAPPPPPKQTPFRPPIKQTAIPPPPKQKTMSLPQKQMPHSLTPPDVQEDGWRESNNSDSDLLDFDDGFGNVPVPTTNTSCGDKQLAFSQQDGWDDDNDVVGDLNELGKSVESGWGDDDDFFGDDSSEMLDFPPHATVRDPRREQLLRDLKGYVSSLDHMLSSVNAVLEYEYNTPQKAMELIEYYQTRANLAEYTRTKELSRMDYRIVLPNGDVVLDKHEIALNFMPDQSLAARCANQSLLADLLQVITDKDLLVRPQFMAICIAHDCKFTIHIHDETVEAAAHLHISLPQADGQRADIANIFVTITFIPHQPMVHFRVNTINVLLQDHEVDEVLSSSANFLMECQMDEFAQDATHSTPADVYRDAFMENSQKLLAQSAVGMKSALQEMESVINIKQKLNIVKRFIPDTDALLAAEQEAMEFATKRQGFQQQPIEHPSAFQAGPSRPQMGSGQPRPPPPPPPRQIQPAGSRPQSILGGLVRSGLNKLANSVALPDDDPAIYGQAAPEVPSFYRKDGPHAAHQGNQAQEDLSEGFPQSFQDAPQEQRSLPSHAKRTAPKPPVGTFGREQRGDKTEQVDLSRGFPRPVHQARPDPAPPEHRRTSGVDLSKGFPRPPPGPPPSQQQKSQVGDVDLSRGFPRPPPQPPARSKVLSNEEVDLTKGFPRPPPATPSRRPNQDQLSNAVGIVEDGWEDGSLDDDFSNTSKDHASEPIERPPPTPREYFAFDATNYVYDPETDIIPTIKRWKNLRPHRPYVVW